MDQGDISDESKLSKGTFNGQGHNCLCVGAVYHIQSPREVLVT